VIGNDHRHWLMAEPDEAGRRLSSGLGVRAPPAQRDVRLPEAAPAAEGCTSGERGATGPAAVATLHGALRQALHLGHN
jgi:hypothetical protein